MNTVCMYHLKQNGNGDLEFTKLGEYDQLNHTAEFVLNGEANESIVVRIDYHDHGAEMHYYEVEQPRNQTIAAVVIGVAFLGLLAYSALKNERFIDVSLLGGSRNFVDVDRRVCGAGLCAVRHRNAELHGLTNRAAARGRLLSGDGGSAVRNVRSRSSSVGRVKPFLALAAVFAFLAVLVVFGKGLEEGFVIATGSDLPVKGPEHVVKDVFHAVVAFKHHFLNFLRLASFNDELPLGEEGAVAEVIEEAHLVLDAVHDVDDFQEFGNVFFADVFVHERQLEKGAVFIGLKHTLTFLVLEAF